MIQLERPQPTVSLRIEEILELSDAARHQLVPLGAPPGAIHLSCNGWGMVWVVESRGLSPPDARLYLHEQVPAARMLADRMLAEDPRGGRFYVTLHEVVRTRDREPIARVLLVG